MEHRGQDTRHDVLVVGGGLVGASLAIALEGAGIDVGLVDASPPGALPEVFDQRSLSFGEATVNALRALGVLQHLRVAPAPIRRIHASRRGDFGRVVLDAADHGREAFGSVVVARERVSEHGDDLESLRDLSRAAPLLAWPMTIAMLALAGFPATAGFIGKFFLIDATVAGDYAWLGIAIVVGSMISLVYYLRVVAVMWMDRLEVELPTVPPRFVKPVSGWSPEADPRATPELVAVAVLAAAATIALGIVPSPLFDAVRDVGTSIASLV